MPLCTATKSLKILLISTTVFLFRNKLSTSPPKIMSGNQVVGTILVMLSLPVLNVPEVWLTLTEPSLHWNKLYISLLMFMLIILAFTSSLATALSFVFNTLGMLKILLLQFCISNMLPNLSLALLPYDLMQLWSGRILLSQSMTHPYCKHTLQLSISFPR